MPIFDARMSDNSPTTSNGINTTSVIALMFVSFYALGWLFPDPWWGTHFLAFLSPVSAVLLLGISVALALGDRWLHKIPLDFSAESWNQPRRILAYVSFGLFSALAFYHLPIFSDYYGDSPKFIGILTNEHYPSSFHWDLFWSMDVMETKIGERTVLNGAVLFGRMLGLDAITGFKVFVAMCGGIYVALGSAFSVSYFKSVRWRAIFILLFASSPIILNFCGHIEIYAPTLVAYAAFFMCILMLIKSQKILYLILAVVVFLICLKLHSATLRLLSGTLAATVVYWLVKDNDIKSKIFRWKWVGVGVSALLIGALGYAYFFVYKDHVDERFLVSDLAVMERLFLPLFSPEAPLDRYNLLSFNHIFDYFNNVLIWSSGALMLLTAFLVKFRKRINWNTPEIMISGVTMIFVGTFFFMVNPLLGMPIDWDLFSIAAPIFILFVATIAQQLDTEETGRTLVGPVLAVALLSLCILPVNTDKEAYGNRMISIGTHTFKTYWITGVADIDHGLHLIPQEEYEERHVELIKVLEPYAVAEKDIEYAELLRRYASFLRRQKQDAQAALPYHYEAAKYDPSNLVNYMGLMEANHLTGNHLNALRNAELLMANQYPDPVRSLSFGIHMALEAERYDNALQYTTKYLELNPNNQVIREIHENLQRGTNLSELKRAFGG